MNSSNRLSTNYSELADLVGLNNMDAYVHIGEGTDNLLQYLTRIDGEDNRYAFVHTGTKTMAFIPPRQMAAAANTFPGDKLYEIGTDGVVTSIQEVLGDDVSVIVPETVPVGAVREFESVYPMEVVPEPDTVWGVKNEDEISILADLAKGVQHGIARAETVLAVATAEDEALIWNDRSLTTDRLRVEVKKALAEYGLDDFGNVIIGAGPSCADLHFTGNDTIEPHETVLLDLSPRGDFGYYGDISRTFVPGTPNKWAVKIYDIVNEAIEAAFSVLERGAGITAGELYRAMADVIESHGYSTGLHETQDDTIGLYHGTGHGIGVQIHEKPFQTYESDVVLESENVLTVEPGVYDPSRGGVRLEDTIVVRKDGFENLMDYPRDIIPVTRDPSPYLN